MKMSMATGTHLMTTLMGMIFPTMPTLMMMDGVNTIAEYDKDGDGVPDDTDGDGIPDYLDND